MRRDAGLGRASLRQPALLLVAGACFAAAAALAWHHPLSPVAALALLGLWCVVAARWPGLWLFVVPACLPFLNFSPWTGWLIFEEFDMLLLGALAGGYGRRAWAARCDSARQMPAGLPGLLALLGGTGLLGLLRGFSDAGGWRFDWFAGYADALNSLRVFKSLGLALLFVPLLQQAVDPSSTKAGQRLAGGMVTGLTVVVLAVLWERADFPGLLDFSQPYRTVGLFWEMHVGGAALDVYLVLATPFVLWALGAARRPLSWAGAAALALLTGYAGLTTFSRGVYAAIAFSLVLLGGLRWCQGAALGARGHDRPGGWRGRAGWLLMLALALEVAAVLGGGSFMRQRLERAGGDLGSRVAHWQHGLALLQGPADWLLGKGVGRLPANYAAQVAHGGFPGEVKAASEVQLGAGPNGFVTLRGPHPLHTGDGSYALTQRVAGILPGQHRISLAVRVQVATDLELALCERHLLYERACQSAVVQVWPGAASWQALTLPLEGPALAGGPWHAWRSGVLALSVLNAGGAADVDQVRLNGELQALPLENGDFSRGLARWFPVAQSYFLPWHLDNLLLEVLVERGLLGLLGLLSLLAYAMWQLVGGRARRLALAPCLVAALAGVLLLGLVSSVMDMPRVAFLFYLLTLFSSLSGQAAERLAGIAANLDKNHGRARTPEQT